MARLIVILGLAMGFWLRDFQMDRSPSVGSPSARGEVGEVTVMDGCDPFPTLACAR